MVLESRLPVPRSCQGWAVVIKLLFSGGMQCTKYRLLFFILLQPECKDNSRSLVKRSTLHGDYPVDFNFFVVLEDDLSHFNSNPLINWLWIEVHIQNINIQRATVHVVLEEVLESWRREEEGGSRLLKEGVWITLAVSNDYDRNFQTNMIIFRNSIRLHHRQAICKTPGNSSFPAPFLCSSAWNHVH